MVEETLDTICGGVGDERLRDLSKVQIGICREGHLTKLDVKSEQ